MIHPARRASVVAIAATGLVLGLGFQGSRGLFETTEGRYAEVAREMLEADSWLTPTLDHHPHWTKPPLTYWAIAGGLALVGRNEWGVRLANGLALPLVALGVAGLAALMWGWNEALLAGLIYASSLFPVVAASTVSTDLLLALWETWAMVSYWGAVRASGKTRGRLTVVFWVCLGLAFLTKGPPGLLPLLPIVAYILVARRRGWPHAGLWSPLGLVLFGVVGLTWYLWAVLSHPGLLAYFLGDEVVARVATDRFGRNPEWWKPTVIYGAPLALGLGPWLAWRPAATIRTLRAGPRGWTAESAFLALWLGLPLIVLSISRSRLPLYVLPIFPAIVLAFARAHAMLEGNGDRLRRPPVRWVLISVTLLLSVKALSVLVPSPKDMRPLALAVERAEPDRVVLLGEEALFGLEFYLDVPVERQPLPSEGPLPGPAGSRSQAAPGVTLFLARTLDDERWSVGIPAGCAGRTAPLVPPYRGLSVVCPARAAALRAVVPSSLP